MKKRIITGLILSAITGVLIYFAGVYFAVVALICICFALGANEEELQYLLKYTGHSPLYVRRKRDVIIWFGLKKGETLETVNENLLCRGLQPLFKKKKKCYCR